MVRTEKSLGAGNGKNHAVPLGEKERFWAYAKRKSGQSADISRRMAVRIDKTARAGKRLTGLNCNLRCIFCHGDSFMERKGESAVDNAFFINSLKRLHALSQKKVEVHISGRGEPTLCGNELVEIVGLMNELQFVTRVKLTSNGLLLGKMARELSAAGLASVNVSLHSLKREEYKRITGVDALERVLESIDQCIEAGIPAKINCTSGPGFEGELEQYLELSRTKRIPVKLFYILSKDGEETNRESELVLTRSQVLLEERAEIVEEYSYPYNGKVMYIEGAIVDLKDSRVNVCKNKACEKRAECLEGCRYSIRITSDGYMQPCPVRIDNIVNLRDANVGDKQIIRALISGGKYALVSKERRD